MAGKNGTMKTAVYYNNRDVRIEERPIPELQPGDLLVKTEACGLCGGETMEWYLAKRAPKILGHEPTGVVEQVGPGENKFKEGDRVFAHHHVGCMSCHFCKRGFYTMCDHYGQTRLDPGGFAEYFRVPAENVRLDTLLLPDHVSFEEGTIIEPMACAMHGIKTAGIQPGDTVAIVGVGFIGQCFVQLASIWRAGIVAALDLNDWRLEKARSLGASHTINPAQTDAVEMLRSINNGRLADAVIVTAPSGQAWQMALSLCEKGGAFHCGAPPSPDVEISINPNSLYFREITINSAFSANHIETSAVLELLAAGRLNANAMITHRFGLEGVGEAIRMLLEAGESLKTLIIPAQTKG